MTIGEHLSELRSRILHIVIAIIIVSIFTMTFQLRPFDLSNISSSSKGSIDGNSTRNTISNINSNGIFANPHQQLLLIYYPYPNTINNLAAQIVRHMERTLLPPSVRTIQTAPGQAFTTDLYVSVLVGIIISVPIISKEVVGFIFPAFSKQTRTTFFKIMLIILALFVTGATFAYVYLVPFTINFLYSYGGAIQAMPFFNIGEFIPFVLQFLLGVGLAFELPIIMYAISLTGVVGEKFWRDNFRYAILAFVILGAAITPDGSGITMWFVAAPMILLYLMGMLAIRRRERSRNNNNNNANNNTNLAEQA